MARIEPVRMSVGTRVLVSVNAAQSVALREVFQFRGEGEDGEDQGVGKWCCCLSLSGFGCDLSCKSEDHGHRIMVLALSSFEGCQDIRYMGYRTMLQLKARMLRMWLRKWTYRVACGENI